MNKVDNDANIVDNNDTMEDIFDNDTMNDKRLKIAFDWLSLLA